MIRASQIFRIIFSVCILLFYSLDSEGGKITPNSAPGFEISNLKYTQKDSGEYILLENISLDFKGARGDITDAIDWVEPVGECCIKDFSQEGGKFIVRNGSCKVKKSSGNTYYINIYLKDSEGRESNLLRLRIP